MEHCFLFKFTEDSLFTEIKIKAITEAEAKRLLKLTVNLNGCNIESIEKIY